MEPSVPFDAPWQARAFAVVVGLHRSGRLDWPAWTAALGRHIASDPGRPYHEAWLAAAEEVAAEILGTTGAAISVRLHALAHAQDHAHDHGDGPHHPVARHPVAVSPASA